MASSTIFWVACLSCPCFLESSERCEVRSSHCSCLNRIEMTATSTREVEARSAAWYVGEYCQLAQRGSEYDGPHIARLLLQYEQLVERLLNLASLRRVARSAKAAELQTQATHVCQ